MVQQGEVNVSLLLILGTISIILMILFIVLFVAFYQRRMIRHQLALQELRNSVQRELLEATLQVQENERHRIAKDLHDEIGATLSAVRLSLIQATRGIPEDSPAAEAARSTKELLDEIMQSVRRIAKELTPATLEAFGLIDALEELCARIRDHSPIHVNFRHSGLDRRFDRQVEISLYRIAQELLSNTLKHAEASRIEMELSVIDEQLHFWYWDNGRGFDLDKMYQRPPRERGLGLKNIESRVNVVNGVLTYPVVEKKGAAVQVLLPIR